MSYILKQKFNIADLVEKLQQPKHVLVIEPEYYLRHLYLGHLSRHGFNSSAAGDFNEGLNMILTIRPDAALIALSSEEDYDYLLKGITHMRRVLPEIPMVTLGQSLSSQVLSRLMSLGVSSHLEKSLTRPNDIIEVIKIVLHH
jgi:DNA-binding response OmpR family regulator